MRDGVKNRRGTESAEKENEVLRVAQVCVQYQVPVTVRGAGTGNYGQCVPLVGGVIVDMTRMDGIRWIQPGLACVEPGVKMAAFDKACIIKVFYLWSRFALI